MEGIFEAIAFIVIIGFICVVATILVNRITSTGKYCNSNYNCADEYSKLEIDYPEYKVQEIYKCSCSNQGPCMAKYVLWNFYLKGKDNVEHQELILYDEVGKYNIGDKLMFTKI